MLKCEVLFKGHEKDGFVFQLYIGTLEHACRAFVKNGTLVQRKGYGDAHMLRVTEVDEFKREVGESSLYTQAGMRRVLKKKPQLVDIRPKRSV